MFRKGTPCDCERTRVKAEDNVVFPCCDAPKVPALIHNLSRSNSSFLRLWGLSLAAASAAAQRRTPVEKEQFGGTLFITRRESMTTVFMTAIVFSTPGPRPSKNKNPRQVKILNKLKLLNYQLPPC